MHREEEDKDMVGEGLRIAVHGMEGVRCKGRGDDPFVVGLVEAFVEEGNMQPSVNPIDAVVGEEEETGRATGVSWSFKCFIIERKGLSRTLGRRGPGM